MTTVRFLSLCPLVTELSVWIQITLTRWTGRNLFTKGKLRFSCIPMTPVARSLRKKDSEQSRRAEILQVERYQLLNRGIMWLLPRRTVLTPILAFNTVFVISVVVGVDGPR